MEAAYAAPFPTGARTKAVTSPMTAPAVAISTVALVAFSPAKSARINTVLISTSSHSRNQQVFVPQFHHR